MTEPQQPATAAGRFQREHHDGACNEPRPHNWREACRRSVGHAGPHYSTLDPSAYSPGHGPVFWTADRDYLDTSDLLRMLDAAHEAADRARRESGEALEVEALAETLYRYYPGPNREHNWSFWQTRARNMLAAMAYHRAALAAAPAPAAPEAFDIEAMKADVDAEVEAERHAAFGLRYHAAPAAAPEATDAKLREAMLAALDRAPAVQLSRGAAWMLERSTVEQIVRESGR